MKIFSLIPIIGSLACFLSAEHLTLKDGSLLRDAVVSRKGIDHVIIRYDGGVKRVDYDELTIDLQDRFGMTPKEVRARLAAQEARQQAALDREERDQQRHLQLLKDAQQLPRYVTDGDVRRLFLYYGDLSTVAAEYLAAEWNRREALRLNLDDEAKKYAEYAALVRSTFQKEKAAALRAESKQESQTAKLRELQQELKLAKQREAEWKKQEKKYQEKLEEYEEEYRDLLRDYERERNANRIRFTPGVPVYIPPRGRNTGAGRTIVL